MYREDRRYSTFANRYATQQQQQQQQQQQGSGFPPIQKMVTAGFYLSPTTNFPDRVICFCCGVRLTNWKPDCDPKKEHAQYSPTCALVTNTYGKWISEKTRRASFTTNFPRISLPSTSTSTSSKSTSTSTSTSSSTETNSTGENVIEQWPYVTSSNFSATPSSLAAAGFYANPCVAYPDRVTCFCCGVSLVQWEPLDDPRVEHCKHSRLCPFACGEQTQNIPDDDGRSTAYSTPKSQPEQQDTSVLTRQMEGLKLYSKLSTHFYCPITHDVMKDPVIIEDGHTYEFEAIRTWLDTHDTSPMTNQKLYSKRILPNFNLRAQLIELAEKALAEQEFASKSKDNDGVDEDKKGKKKQKEVTQLVSTEAGKKDGVDEDEEDKMKQKEVAELVWIERKENSKNFQKDPDFRLLISDEQISLFQQQLSQLRNMNKINNLIFVLKTLERFSVSLQQLQKVDLLQLLIILSSHENPQVASHSQRILQRLTD